MAADAFDDDCGQDDLRQKCRLCVMLRSVSRRRSHQAVPIGAGGLRLLYLNPVYYIATLQVAYSRRQSVGLCAAAHDTARGCPAAAHDTARGCPVSRRMENKNNVFRVVRALPCAAKHAYSRAIFSLYLS